MTKEWPVAELSGIDRLHVLSAGLPGTAVVERTFDAPFDEVWGWVSDLERSVPRFDRDVADLRVRARHGDHLRIAARVPWRLGGFRVGFDAELTEGWCWMVARNGLYVVGMAAEPDGDGTRFAHLEGLTLRGPRWLQVVATPVMAISRWRHRRHLPHDLAGIARGLGLDPSA